MKYSDEIMNLNGRKVDYARMISRITPAPLINLYVGIIISFTSPISLGPILTPLTSLIICILFMVALPVAPIVFEAWRGHIDLDVSDQEKRARISSLRRNHMTPGPTAPMGKAYLTRCGPLRFTLWAGVCTGLGPRGW